MYATEILIQLPNPSGPHRFGVVNLGLISRVTCGRWDVLRASCSRSSRAVPTGALWGG